MSELGDLEQFPTEDAKNLERITRFLDTGNELFGSDKVTQFKTIQINEQEQLKFNIKNSFFFFQIHCSSGKIRQVKLQQIQKA